MSKSNHVCPLCKGSGKVSARIANSRVTIRDRKKYNETMRAVNQRARDRKKVSETLAT